MASGKTVRSFEELAQLVRQRFAAMSPQFQMAMQFLLDHPDEVAVSSMRTVAARSKVQPATLVRLAQALDFPGWPEFRALFVDRLRSRPEPYAARAKSLVKREPTKELVAELFRAHRLNLDNTEAQNGSILPRVAQLLKRASTVHVAGFRACFPIAFAFLYVYRLFRPSVSLVGGESGTLEMQLRAIERNDAVLVISFAPYSSEARKVVTAARKAGAKVVALTDSAVAPIALHADERLLFSVSSPSFFPSLVAGIGAAESLLEILVSQGGDEAVRQIECAERQLYESGAYEQLPARAARSRLAKSHVRRPAGRS